MTHNNRTTFDGTLWLYLTTHNPHNGQISMPPVRFEPKVSADEWPQTHAVDRAATGICHENIYKPENKRGGC